MNLFLRIGMQCFSSFIYGILSFSALRGMGVQINKCSFEWSEIENSKTNNFCQHCKICVPDFSRKSISEVQREIPNYQCARFHRRHLEEGQKEFHFINRFERKMERLGFVKLTSILVLIYLFIVGCGMKHRTVGAYSDFRQRTKTSLQEINRGFSMYSEEQNFLDES